MSVVVEKKVFTYFRLSSFRFLSCRFSDGRNENESWTREGEALATVDDDEDVVVGDEGVAAAAAALADGGGPDDLREMGLDCRIYAASSKHSSLVPSASILRSERKDDDQHRRLPPKSLLLLLPIPQPQPPPLPWPSCCFCCWLVLMLNESVEGSGSDRGREKRRDVKNPCPPPPLPIASQPANQPASACNPISERERD